MLVRYTGPTDQVNHEVARALAAQREDVEVELENQIATVPGDTVRATGLDGEASAVLEPGRAYNLPHELAEGLVASSPWWERVTDYDKLTKEALLELAGERDIEGRSSMNKTQLVKALRDTPAPTPPAPANDEVAGPTPATDIGAADTAGAPETAVGATGAAGTATGTTGAGTTTGGTT